MTAIPTFQKPAPISARPLTIEERVALIVALQGGMPVPVDVAMALAQAIAVHNSGDAEPLSILLNLKRQRGQRTVSAYYRNALLREAADTFYPDHRASEAARHLHSRWQSYFNTAWQRGEWNCHDCPEGHVGKLEELFWQMMRIKNSVLSVDRIRAIIA
jgi:hypothetical protein